MKPSGGRNIKARVEKEVLIGVAKGNRRSERVKITNLRNVELLFRSILYLFIFYLCPYKLCFYFAVNVNKDSHNSERLKEFRIQSRLYRIILPLTLFSVSIQTIFSTVR